MGQIEVFDHILVCKQFTDFKLVKRYKALLETILQCENK